MNPKLSLRISLVLPVIQQRLDVSEYWKFQNRIIDTGTFEDLTKSDQALITEIEDEYNI